MRRWMVFLVPLLIAVMILASCSSGRSRTQPESTNPASTAAIIPETSSSNELIDTALAKGTIDHETALTYKVYAQFLDIRLPSAYLGSVNLNTDSHIIDEIQSEFPDLSPETQAILLPYLVPPVYQGAWGPPAEGASTNVNTIDLPCSQIETDQWDSKSAMHSPVRFWWLKSRPGDEDVANSFMTAMDDEIWPKLTTLMGRIPLPDEGTECNGGGPEFDIYITPQIARSYAAAYYPPGCKETPGYIVMNPAVSNAILAHEFMHSIQWSYNTSADCMYPGEYAWLAEATASWAQNYVYPDSNEEHAYVEWFYKGGSGGQPPKLTLRNDSHEYGTHLFFFYLTHHFGQPDIVKTAWDNTQSMKSVDAVDNAVPGGIEDIWEDFAVENVVEPPYDEYQVWDQLNIKPSDTSLEKDQAFTNGIYPLPNEINPLTIRYDWFTFEDDARLVTFFNGLTYALDAEPINTYMGTLPISDGTTQYKFTAAAPEAVKEVKIQAYFKVAGDTEWRLEDWTDQPYMSFCRDASAERLTDLIVITSNSSPDQVISSSGAYRSFLQTSDIGCWRYGGTASMLFTGEGEGGSFIDEQQLPNVVFERTDVHPNIPYPYLHFAIAEGQLDRTYDYQGEDCTGNGESHNPLSPCSMNNYGNDLYILYGAQSGPSIRRYSGEANANQPMTVDFQCKDGPGSSPNPSMVWFYADMLSQILNKVYTVGDDGKLEGSDNLLQSADNSQMQFTWHFESLYESGSSEGSASSAGSSTAGQAGSSSSNGSGSGAPQSPADAGFPDVPDYPNVESSSLMSGSGMLSLFTPDSEAVVIDYYRGQLTTQGWQEAPNQSTPEMTMLMFAKGTKMITLMIAPMDNGTQIIIYEAGK